MDANVKSDIEKAILDKLDCAVDNLYRANIAARGADITFQWGESGQTLQQIIDDYQAEKNRWARALQSLRE